MTRAAADAAVYNSRDPAARKIARGRAFLITALQAKFSRCVADFLFFFRGQVGMFGVGFGGKGEEVFDGRADVLVLRKFSSGRRRNLA